MNIFLGTFYKMALAPTFGEVPVSFLVPFSFEQKFVTLQKNDIKPFGGMSKKKIIFYTRGFVDGDDSDDDWMDNEMTLVMQNRQIHEDKRDNIDFTILDRVVRTCDKTKNLKHGDIVSFEWLQEDRDIGCAFLVKRDDGTLIVMDDLNDSALLSVPPQITADGNDAISILDSRHIGVWLSPYNFNRLQWVLVGNEYIAKFQQISPDKNRVLTAIIRTQNKPTINKMFHENEYNMTMPVNTYYFRCY